MDEAWIQQSLARLEQLEGYKAQVQAGGYAVDLSEVDAEIAALYEVLESVAEPEPEPAPPPQPYVAPYVATSNPFEQPAYAPPVSPAWQPSPAPVWQPSPAPVMTAAPTYDPGMSSTYDIDDAPKSKAPFLAVGVLAVIGLGAGGWFVAGQGGDERPAAAAPAGDPSVIDASAIPTDTQEPQVAKGGDAQRTEGFKIKESNRPAARGNNDRRSAPRPDPRPKKTDKEPHKLGIDSSRDPLAGAR